MILVVEDDPNIRVTLVNLLELEGFAVSCEANGREAMDLLRSGHSPSLILLDMMMPVMSGWDFLEARSRDETIKAIPVIAMSALADTQSRIMPGQVTAYYRKPIDLDTLLDTLKAYITG